MKIIDKQVKENTLILVFDQALPPVGKTITVGIDNAENYYKNSKALKHDLLYESPAIVDGQIHINLPTDVSALLIITAYIDGTKCTAMFLNSYMLFKAQNRHLSVRNCTKCTNDMCQDCNEKNWRTEAIAILLRTRLLDYAYQNDLMDDAICFYTGIVRVLDMDGITFESIPEFRNNLNNYVAQLL